MMSELLAFTGGGETIGGHAKECGTPCCTNVEREYLLPKKVLLQTPSKAHGFETK